MITELLALAGEGNVTENAPLERYTTFRIGGPADVLVNVSDAKTLQGVLRVLYAHNVPYYIIGRGSNLVFSDAGFRGAVVRLCDLSGSGARACGTAAGSGFAVVSEDDTSALLYAFAGTSLAGLASFACERELSGLEFASGIPGSVGGGVVMNAGAYNGELMDCVVRSEYIGPAPEFEAGVLEGEAQRFAYRESIYQHNGCIVTGAYFRLAKGRTRAEIAARMRELNGRRREKQPLELPSAGSAFRRPPNDFAGRLIEAAGLRGFRIGGAQVSEKHCGFIVNRGGATAEDVRALVDAVREKVLAASGVLLVPEIKFVEERG